MAQDSSGSAQDPIEVLLFFPAVVVVFGVGCGVSYCFSLPE
jgi:hypothetical protein